MIKMNHAVAKYNKANRRDLIAATGLVIVLILDLNRWFLNPCDVQIWWKTSKNNRAPFIYYVKLWTSFQSHQRIQTWVTVRKCSIHYKIGGFLSHVTLKIDGRPWKSIGHIFYAASSFVQRTFHSHQWVQTGVTVRKRPILIKIEEIIWAVRPWMLMADIEHQ